MSLKHAMLGFLDMTPLTGYDIKNMFNASANYFWSTTHSQIYRTLTEMSKDGLLDVEIIYQSDYPNKKLFHITDKGKKELHNWLLTSFEIPPVRHKLLVQLTWADKLTDNEIIAKFQEYEQKLNERLKIYKSKNQQNIINQNARTKREAWLWQLTLNNGIETYEAELKWVKKAQKELKNVT